MGLWDDVRSAATDARNERDQLRAHVMALADRVTRRRRPAPDEPPTITVDASGQTYRHGAPPAVVILGQSLLLAASSLLAAGLAWLAALFLGLWLFIQRALGLHVRVPAAPASR